MIQTILVPTDFSATSQNAALYAVSLAKQSATTKIVLYHSYSLIKLPPNPNGVVDESTPDTNEKESSEKLKAFEDFVRSSAGTIEVQSFHSSKTLSEGIDEVCTIAKPDLIVMGITGGGIVKAAVVGSNSITIAKHTNIPVIIVPTDVPYASIDRTLLVTDFIDVESTIPVNTISSILQVTSSSFYILHVTSAIEKVNEVEKAKLETMFAERIPEYHIIQDSAFENAVEKFVEDNRIDLVVIVPKQRGLLESAFTKNHTKALAFHIKKPLLVTHI